MASATEAIPFDTWTQQIPEGSRGLQDDPDGDGLVNLVEYAFGLNPLEASRAGLPTVSFAGGISTYSFTKPKSVVGVQYIVRVSDTATRFEQRVTPVKVDETDATEIWAVDFPADGPEQFAWTSLVKLITPSLTGHAEAQRPAEFDRVLPYEIQAAFNNDTFFWHLSYPGDEGKRHDYYRFTNGAWQKEGGDRRDGQSTLDQEPDQGEIGQNSTIYEQRTSIMMSDPNAISHVTNFDKFGCFLACHNQSRNMPEWTVGNGEDTKYIDLTQVTDGGANNPNVLDLWHWRGARSNPIGRSDDQHVLTKFFSNDTDGDDGGRKGDSGKGPFTTQKLVDGHPKYVFDPSTTGGEFAFQWDDFWGTPHFYITLPDATDLGPNAPNPTAMLWDDAVAMGYVPSEGDTVPRRVLRAGEGSRADITAAGTEFIRESPDTLYGPRVLGTWSVQLQRLLDTGHDDDVKLVPGNTYHVAFEVHLWEYTARDHYVSFPMSLTLGEGGDIAATDLRGPGATGRDVLPDWSDTQRFPVKKIHLFQPGITTWEFVSGQNLTEGKVFVDPVTGLPVNQLHIGATVVQAAAGSCTSCHTVRVGETRTTPPLLDGGAMEEHVPERGGVWAPTPIAQP